MVRSSVRCEPPPSSDPVSGARFRCSRSSSSTARMDDRTLKVEIAKSGGAGGKDGVPQQRRAQRSLLHMEKWSSLTTPSSPVSGSPAGGAQGGSAAGSACRYEGDATFQISISRLGVLARMVGQEDGRF